MEGLEGQDLVEDLGQVGQVRLGEADALVVRVTGVAGVEDVVVAGAGRVDVGEHAADAVRRDAVHDRVPEADAVAHERGDDRVRAVQLRVYEAGTAVFAQPADRGAVDQVTGLRVAVGAHVRDGPAAAAAEAHGGRRVDVPGDGLGQAGRDLDVIGRGQVLHPVVDVRPGHILLVGRLGFVDAEAAAAADDILFRGLGQRDAVGRRDPGPQVVPAPDAGGVVGGHGRAVRTGQVRAARQRGGAGRGDERAIRRLVGRQVRGAQVLAGGVGARVGRGGERGLALRGHL